MKILIVSNSPWRNDNSFGNSFSNIFEGIDDLEIANIYCKYGKPNAAFVKRFFQITEKSLINNALKGTPSGKETFVDSDEKCDEGEKAFNAARKHKGVLMFWARTLIWKLGKWKSKELVDFIDDFNPDLLFIPIYYSGYIHSINKFIKNKWNLPCVGYVSDDVYTMRRFSLSPLFWLDRLFTRPTMKRVFSWCDPVYVISDVQKREYAKIFGNKFKILTKCSDFSDDKRPPFKKPDSVLKLIYAGNVSKGRLDILSKLAKAIQTLNENGQKFYLEIYSLSRLNDKQKARLNLENCSKILPAVGYDELRTLQSQADVLVHAESFIFSERLAVHQSFSTKIVDYVATNRCILAIGSNDCASIDYFIRNQNAVVATTEEEIAVKLAELYERKDLLAQYAQRAWECGKKYHQKETMQKMLREDLASALKRRKN